jgi:hypothetical protein
MLSYPLKDAALKLPEGSEPVELQELLAIAPVEIDDIQSAIASWRRANPETYTAILEAEPEN